MFALGVALSVGVVLLPLTYFLVHADADEAGKYIETLQDIAAQRSKNASSDALAAFGEEVRLSRQLYRTPGIERSISRALTVLPRGVSINVVAATYNKEGGVELSLQGVASERAKLIAYVEALKSLSEFANVSLPVSALVAERDAEFTLTLTFKRPKEQS